MGCGLVSADAPVRIEQSCPFVIVHVRQNYGWLSLTIKYKAANLLMSFVTVKTVALYIQCICVQLAFDCLGLPFWTPALVPSSPAFSFPLGLEICSILSKSYLDSQTPWTNGFLVLLLFWPMKIF